MVMKTMPLFSYADLADKHEMYPTRGGNLPERFLTMCRLIRYNFCVRER